MKQPHVAVVGDALIDELRDEKIVREFVGGAALNVAVGLAILGVKTTLIAMVGDDDDGTRIRSSLASFGVELVPTIGPNGSSRAVSDRTEGEPRYEFNTAAQNRRIDFDDAAHAALDAADYVVVSCFPFDDVAQLAALEAAVTAPERRLIIDPNPREGMLRDRVAFCAGFDRVAARSLLSKIGDDDAALLYGTSLDALRQRLLHDGSRVVIATAGRDGASLATRDGIRVAQPIVSLPGPVIDTMGAGDATLASVVESLITVGVPADAAGWHAVLARAMTIAAATCRHEGAQLRMPPAIS
ncbi:MAG: sugar kinase [Microbacteriaceae bacterium]|nr:MAG: sugar kinase [Microbacteriaceae bacterium]